MPAVHPPSSFAGMRVDASAAGTGAYMQSIAASIGTRFSSIGPARPNAWDRSRSICP